MLLHHLLKKKKPKEVAQMLITGFKGQESSAMLCATIVKSQIPMYLGNLNPNWMFWEEVENAIFPNRTEDEKKAIANAYLNYTYPKCEAEEIPLDTTVNFWGVLEAIQTIIEFNRLPIETVTKNFELFSKQLIPDEAVENFAMASLSNEDFLLSDYLNKYGLINAVQYLMEKSKEDNKSFFNSLNIPKP